MNEPIHYINPEALQQENAYLRQRLDVYMKLVEDMARDKIAIQPPQPIHIAITPENEQWFRELLDNQYKKRIEAALDYINSHCEPVYITALTSILKGEQP